MTGTPPVPGTTVASPAQLLETILNLLADDQAEDVVTIDLAGKATFGDHMVVASGRSQRHVGAMADHLQQAIKALLGQSPATEGADAGDWVLIDGGDVIIHLFRPEVREFYQLEKMWTIDLAENARLL